MCDCDNVFQAIHRLAVVVLSVSVVNFVKLAEILEYSLHSSHDQFVPPDMVMKGVA